MPNLAKKKSFIPQNSQSIALTGLMGTGKSTIGKILASQLNLPFYDSDKEIEKKFDSKISTIFSTYGEKSFRANERSVISRLLSKKTCVIATGGGSVLDTKSQQLLSAQTITIWLYTSLEILEKRLINSRNRPLLKNKNILEALKLLSKERNHIYSKSDISVDTGINPPKKIVEQIISELNSFYK